MGNLFTKNTDKQEIRHMITKYLDNKTVLQEQLDSISYFQEKISVDKPDTIGDPVQIYITVEYVYRGEHIVAEFEKENIGWIWKLSEHSIPGSSGSGQKYMLLECISNFLDKCY